MIMDLDKEKKEYYSTTAIAMNILAYLFILFSLISLTIILYVPYWFYSFLLEGV